MKTSRRLLRGAPSYLLRETSRNIYKVRPGPGRRGQLLFSGNIHESARQEEEITTLEIHLSRVAPHTHVSRRLTVSGGDGVTPDGPAATGFHSAALLPAAGCSLSRPSEAPLSQIIVAVTIRSPGWRPRQRITGRAGDAARHICGARRRVRSLVGRRAGGKVWLMRTSQRADLFRARTPRDLRPRSAFKACWLFF